jgi:hypothetical protein
MRSANRNRNDPTNRNNNNGFRVIVAAQEFLRIRRRSLARRWALTGVHPVLRNSRAGAWSRKRPKTEEPGRGW